MKNILIRVDSSSKIGLGHVKRTLLLAQRLQEKSKDLGISFATQMLKGDINAEILNSGFKVHTLKNNSYKELHALITTLSPELLILDSYKIDYLFESKIKKTYPSVKILAFDDLDKEHNVDIVLNHGAHATKKEYKKNKHTTFLCGSKYTLLRDEFFTQVSLRAESNSIAIMLGGNDALNLSGKIAKTLYKINPAYKIFIITTSVNKHLKQLHKIKNATLLVDIDTIAQVLSSVEFVISASGGSLFEVIALKKKFINIQVAPNQKKVVDFLEKKKIYTTIQVKDINKKTLQQKIKYISHSDIYKQLTFHFSRYKLANKIIELIEKG